MTALLDAETLAAAAVERIHYQLGTCIGGYVRGAIQDAYVDATTRAATLPAPYGDALVRSWAEDADSFVARVGTFDALKARALAAARAVIRYRAAVALGQSTDEPAARLRELVAQL